MSTTGVEWQICKVAMWSSNTFTLNHYDITTFLNFRIGAHIHYPWKFFSFGEYLYVASLFLGPLYHISQDRLLEWPSCCRFTHFTFSSNVSIFKEGLFSSSQLQSSPTVWYITRDHIGTYVSLGIFNASAPEEVE